MAFINRDNIIVDIKHVVPLSTRTISSSCSCLMAIETNAGFFKQNKINVGDKVEFIIKEGIEKRVLFG